MKIKRIIIDNFRAFKHEDIEFKDFNCIIGKNDSGKSTILAALEWFFSDKELGVYDTVKNVGGWSNVSSKTCGNIVTKAIEIANRSVEK